MTLGGGLLIGLAALLGGCERQEEIRSYELERSADAPAPVPPTAAAPAQGGQRILVAIVEHRERVWFFRLSGPAGAVEAQEGPFRQFASSLRFTEAEAPVWEVPDGWREEAGSGLRHATFQIEADPEPLELTVIPLPAEAGDVLANVNRWLDQLGADPVDQEQLPQLTEELEVDGRTVTLVDLGGPGGPDDRMAPFAGGPGTPAGPPAQPRAEPQAPAPQTRQTGVAYDVPAAWEEQEAGGMRVASFTVRSDAGEADMSVIPLRGDAGGMLLNVNRWRGEVGLDPIDEPELEAEGARVEVDGHEGFLFDMRGPASQDAERLRTLAAILPRSEQTWFFKMIGPDDVVEPQKEAFAAFVSSFRFGEGAPSGYE